MQPKVVRQLRPSSAPLESLNSGGLSSEISCKLPCDTFDDTKTVPSRFGNPDACLQQDTTSEPRRNNS